MKFVELMVGGDKESTLSSDKGYLDHCMKILKSILKDNGGHKRMSMSKYLIREQYKKIKKLKDMSGAYIPDFFVGFQKIMKEDLKIDKDPTKTPDEKWSDFLKNIKTNDLFGTDTDILDNLYNGIKTGIKIRTESNAYVTPDEEMCHSNIGFAFNKETTDLLNSAIGQWESDLNSDTGFGSSYGCKVKSKKDEDDVEGENMKNNALSESKTRGLFGKKSGKHNEIENESSSLLNSAHRFKNIYKEIKPDDDKRMLKEEEDTKKMQTMEDDLKKSKLEHKRLVAKQLAMMMREYMNLVYQAKESGCEEMFTSDDIEIGTALTPEQAKFQDVIIDILRSSLLTDIVSKANASNNGIMNVDTVKNVNEYETNKKRFEDYLKSLSDKNLDKTEDKDAIDGLIETSKLTDKTGATTDVNKKVKSNIEKMEKMFKEKSVEKRLSLTRVLKTQKDKLLSELNTLVIVLMNTIAIYEVNLEAAPASAPASL